MHARDGGGGGYHPDDRADRGRPYSGNPYGDNYSGGGGGRYGGDRGADRDWDRGSYDLLLFPCPGRCISFDN